MFRLAGFGGMAREGGRCALPSTTYPGFASLLTGRLPENHGVRTTNEAPAGAGSWARVRTVVGSTLFDSCKATRLRSAAIQGDQKLHAVLATERAAEIWPPGGMPSAGTKLDAHGYPVNAEIRPFALAALADHDLRFVFVHLNETDTLGHDLGPGHPATLAAAWATDALVGELVDALGTDWERSVLVVTSDHDMEPRTGLPPIRLGDVDGLETLVLHVAEDGGAAVLELTAGASPATVGARLDAVPGVAAVRAAGPGLAIAEARRGWVFAGAGATPGGSHGGPATARTLAIVGGGHPSVGHIADSIARRRPHLVDWAPTIASILGLRLESMDGIDLGA
jgi:Type I phosphodiesterase / nucleotide pyrophosphatase